MLQAKSASVSEERNSRKLPMSDDEARELLGKVHQVWIGRGTKIVKQKAAETSPDDLKGRSGNVRAPLIRKGKTLLVGFHRDSLSDLL